jgi:hypothetical protein
MSKKRILILLVLIPITLFWSFAAFIGRADSLEEVNTGKFMDWITLGPLWACLVYIVLGSLLSSHKNGRGIVFGAVICTWIAVALTSNWWEDKKIQMRMEHWNHRQMQGDGAATNSMSTNLNQK